MSELTLPKPLQTLLELSKRQVAKVNLTATENTWQADKLSKIGGIGYLPIGESYPTNEQGEPLALLFQLNFEQLANEADISQLAYKLPNKGILQFFIDDDEYLGIKKNQIRYYANIDLPINDNELSKAIEFLKDIDGNIDGKFWLSFDIKSQFLMSFELISQSCNFNCLEYNKFVNEIDELKNKSVYDYLNEFGEKLSADYYRNYMTLANRNQNGNSHYILGYPNFTQSEPREFACYSDDDDLICYDEVEYQKEFERYISLLQIDTHYNQNGYEEIMWGDCGIANFFIHPNDLKNRDFSKLVYYWDCS